jgi:PAS domain S-box-containing protein
MPARKRPGSNYRDRILEFAPVSIVAIQNERIVYINSTGAKAIGISPEEIIGKNFTDILAPESSNLLKVLHRKRLSGQQVPMQYETTLVLKNGMRIECDVRVKKIKLDGRDTYLATIYGLTDRKKNEKRSIEEEKSKIIHNFSAGISNALMELTEELKDSLSGLKILQQDEDNHTYGSIQKIEHTLDQLLKLQESLSLISGNGSPVDEVETMTLKDLVLMAIKDFQDISQITSHNHKISIKTYFRSQVMVRCNPLLLKKAIYNIIQNSVDAIEPKGEVYITTEDTDSTGYIYIQDGGGGIEPSVMNQIFEPFFCRKKDKNHLGLGLTISKAIIERYGGTIEAISQPGQGSTFIIKLPVQKSQKKTTLCSNLKKLNHAFVLIIDDECVFNNLLSRALTSRGIKVTFCSSMDKAIRILKRKRVDLIIGETSDPEKEGIHMMISRLKAIDQEVPVLILTDKEQVKKNTSGWGLGGCFFHTRPFQMDLLLKQIYVLLSQRLNSI